MSGQVVQLRPTIGYDFESLTVTNSVQVLTPSKYKDSNTSGGSYLASITVESADIRYRYDGGTPSGALGHLLTNGSRLTLTGQNQIESFKCFRAAGVDATLFITYERE